MPVPKYPRKVTISACSKAEFSRSKHIRVQRSQAGCRNNQRICQTANRPEYFQAKVLTIMSASSLLRGLLDRRTTTTIFLSLMSLNGSTMNSAIFMSAKPLKAMPIAVLITRGRSRRAWAMSPATKPICKLVIVDQQTPIVCGITTD